MVINTNIAAESSASLLRSSESNLTQSLQRLSSGSKIVSPADDPAGLAVSMGFSAESDRITAVSNNVTNAISYTQTQDGFLQQVSSALDRMSELATSAQDPTETNGQRSLYNDEFQQLSTYISNVTGQTFNGVSLFDNNPKNVTIDSEANTWAMGAVSLGKSAYTTATSQNISTMTGAATALGDVKSAITQLASDRATIGASLSRLNYTSSQLSTEQTNIDSANSAIKDVDVAQESTNYAKLQILVQSGTAMLAQANTMPQSVLKLLG
jgi:flagellin